MPDPGCSLPRKEGRPKLEPEPPPRDGRGRWGDSANVAINAGRLVLEIIERFVS